jgi:salicylate hydroxylase
MLIGADGIHSAVRPVVAGSGDSAPRFTGHVAWRAAAAAPANHPREVRLFMAPGRHLVCYPLEARGKLNLVAVETRDAWVEEGWQHRDRPENLTCAFAGLAPELRAMLDQVEEVHLWGLFQHAVPACWHLGGSGIIGDALHPTLPFMAQGGNLALEDAWVLAECLEEAPGVEQAWAAFTRRRFDRVSRAVARAGRNAGIYHLSQPLLRLGLHTGMRIAGAVAPQMPLRKFDWIYRHDVTGGT